MELPHPVVAILAGAETGVELADMLSTRLGTRNNGEEMTKARRNKYLMGEQVKKKKYSRKEGKGKKEGDKKRAE